MTSRRSIGIVGGGMMGVVLANDLAKAGYSATLYEGADRLGGLATYEHFGPFTWDRFYHCILPGDKDLLAFFEEIDIARFVRWSETRTGIYIDGRTHPLNTALDFALFDALSLWERARLGLAMLRCAAVRDIEALEMVTAHDWFMRIAGEGPYKRILLPLLRSKFGDVADTVSPVYLVAKIKRMLFARTDLKGRENLGYMSGGYHRVWTRCSEVLGGLGVDLRFKTRVKAVEPAADGGARIVTEDGVDDHSRVLFTTPFQVARALTRDWPGGSPVPEQSTVDYMGIVCLIFASHRKVTDNYILNLADELPFTGVIGMTTLISPEEVNGLELVYVPKYVLSSDPLFDATDDEVFDLFLPGLQQVLPGFSPDDLEAWFVRKARIVQPIQETGYSRRVPQPAFDAGPISVVCNAQLTESDLYNGIVVRHAREAVAALLRADGVGSGT